MSAIMRNIFEIMFKFDLYFFGQVRVELSEVVSQIQSLSKEKGLNVSIFMIINMIRREVILFHLNFSSIVLF